MLAEHTSHPHVFCFADQPDWTKQNIKIDLPITFVTHNAGDLKSYEDLWLMTNCKHHVTANSTFSWWGAWLCGNQAKIVVCPEPAEWGESTDVPEGWISLSRSASDPSGARQKRERAPTQGAARLAPAQRHSEHRAGGGSVGNAS